MMMHMLGISVQLKSGLIFLTWWQIITRLEQPNTQFHQLLWLRQSTSTLRLTKFHKYMLKMLRLHPSTILMKVIFFRRSTISTSLTYIGWAVVSGNWKLAPDCRNHTLHLWFSWGEFFKSLLCWTFDNIFRNEKGRLQGKNQHFMSNDNFLHIMVVIHRKLAIEVVKS